MSLWEVICEHIGSASGEPFALQGRTSVGGGCINAAYRIDAGDRRYFVKLNDAATLDMFEAEAQGLHELAQAGAIRVPEPLCWGISANQAYLVMENLSLGGDGSMERFARELAELHRCQSERFGWFRDNTIGATHQPNEWHHDWVGFWRERRLGYQLGLSGARRYGHDLQRRGEELLERFPALFSDYRPAPSLLHGDLWSGNYAMSRNGEPVIFDPAVYYGDREAELAMTELFGGFGPRFYAAYNDSWTLDPGYRVRRDFYNLYHVLNHLNMFGGGYGGQAVSMLERLLAELR